MALQADYRTMLQRIQVETGRTDSTAAQWAGACIAQAINRYRHRQFWFNQETATITCSVGVSNYDIGTDGVTDADEVPYDFIRALTLWWQDPSTSSITDEIEVSDIYAVREMLRHYDDLDGEPRLYTFHGDQLIVAPAPDVAYTLTLDYVKDIGTPGLDYNVTTASSFTVTDPDTPANEIADTYSNAWFTHAEELIRNRAKRIFYSDFLHDPGNASLSAESERIAFQELKGLSLRKKATHRESWS